MKMMKRVGSLLLAAVILTGLAAPVQASSLATPSQLWYEGFDKQGAFTGNYTTKYRFLVDRSALVYANEVDLKNQRAIKELFSGSILYVPISVVDGDKEEALATDKNIKNDNVDFSFKAVEGADYVDNVTLVSGKKEKLKDLPAGMYAKIEFSKDYLPLTKSKVAVRLVLSVNGISYQQTAVTFRCYLQNRVELVTRNSVYGALLPSQFHSLEYTGEATFDFGDSIRYTARVAPRTRYYLNLDTTKNLALDEMYPQAYIECYSFLGSNDKFASPGKLEIPISENKFKEKKTKAEVYVYTIKGNTLKAVSLSVVSYNHLTQTVTITTDTLDDYVLSSRSLLKSVNNDQFDILRSGYADDETDPDEEPGT